MHWGRRARRAQCPYTTPWAPKVLANSSPGALPALVLNSEEEEEDGLMGGLRAREVRVRIRIRTKK